MTPVALWLSGSPRDARAKKRSEDYPMTGKGPPPRGQWRRDKANAGGWVSVKGELREGHVPGGLPLPGERPRWGSEQVVPVGMGHDEPGAVQGHPTGGEVVIG